MPHPFERRVADVWPPSQWREVVVVAAVSGGGDSVALLRSLLAARLGKADTLVAAHFNHGLRPAADEDEQFVAQLCRELDVACEIGRAGPEEFTPCEGSVEAAAREARYAFLPSVAKRIGARFVVTAHTADDQAETILHRVLRGTGIRGLAGMPRQRELAPSITLLRPLLSLRRDAVRQYLADLDQPFREDESNFDEQFTRNRIRQELLPLLAENYNAEIVDSLTRLGRLAGEATVFIEAIAEQLVAQHVSLDQSAVVVQCQHLESESPFIVRSMMMAIWRRQDWREREMTFEKWDQLGNLIQDKTTSAQAVTLPGNILAKKQDEKLTIRHLGKSV